MLKLTAHRSNPYSLTQVDVSYTLTDERLDARFVVSTDIEAHISNDFDLVSFSNMHLWEYDVCEIFLKKEDAQNYLELECSPLSQKLALNVIKPREVVHIAEPINTLISAHQTSTGFECRFSVALSDIPGEGSIIVGNFFCCLGQGESRSYFAANINTDKIVDFHKPELFMRIDP